MSDQPSNRPDDAPGTGAGKAKRDASQLRLITEDEAVVFPDNVEPSDDTPTIISKNNPADAEAIKATGPQHITGSLRGRKLAHFELIEPIGVGGMAAVLRARDTQLDRFVALKILPPDMAKDEENVRRFHQEARAAAKLDHENIARVFFCGEDQRLHFIAFEFVEGENLRTFLDRRGRIPVAEAVRIVLQIATGLEHAASRGVVHRDVKPSNIIISPNGRAKLVDMGLARSLEPHKDQGLTHSGVTLGTFDYISPEQALEPREADSRSDIYSLGCTFYHMLTGHPPVPEGTAGKKLHHHQHVAPIDPRQLNPEVPDEVAAILSRMMAKDPKDRYQRPVHLVQHLMQVAQKVGAMDDISEGPLFVDAPLPGDPRKRPLLLASLGALALALILVLLSLAPPSNNIQPPKGSPNPNPPPNPPPMVGKKVSPPASGKLHIRTEDDLKQLFADPSAPNFALLTKTIDLSEAGLSFQGDSKRELTLACDDLGEPRAIRFKYVARPEAADVVAGLTLDGGTVTFKNITFEIDALGETPDQAAAALAIRGSGNVNFHNCTFVQKGVPQRAFIAHRTKLVPVACVAIDNPSGSKNQRPKVFFDQCHFAGGQNAGAGGQVAIGIAGPAEVHCASCGFRPYGACFHLRGERPTDDIALTLEHCSAFVINGPVFRLDGAATCLVHANKCIFSQPAGAPTDKRDDPDLIRQTDSTNLAVKWMGTRNCYHGLNGLWVRQSFIKSGLDDFRTLVQEAKGQDEQSSQLKMEIPIWEETLPWKEENVARAFRVRPDVSAVRTQDLKHALGIQRFGDVALAPLPAWPEFVAGVKLEANQKLVDPDADENNLPRGVFKHINQALEHANAGDTILIKHGKKSRQVEMRPHRLEWKAGVDLVLKAYPGHAPILNMADTSEYDPALFRLFDGKLHFEDLEFVLEPDQDPLFKAQSVVLMGGNASSTFKNCVLTLNRSRPVPLAVVTLDSGEAPKMARPLPRLTPQIRLHNCFVRGEGKIVDVRASRPLELEVENSLVALNGSLLHVQGATRDAPLESVQVRMNNVSGFVSEPLLALHAGKNLKGLVPTRVEAAKNSLFVALAGKPLVLLEGPDINEDALATYFDWKGEHNAYSSFDKMIEIRKTDELQPVASYGADFFKEPESKSMRAMFNLPAPRNFWTSLPEHFQPRPESKEMINLFGANLAPNAWPQLKKPEAGGMAPE